jgi:hypothetical protein
MIVSPFGPFLMAPGGKAGPPAAAQYWRLRGTPSSQYFHLRNDVPYYSGVFESLDLSGTDRAAALTMGTTCRFRNSSDTDIGTYSSNPFVDVAGNQSYGDTGSAGQEIRLWFDFGSVRTIGSIQLEIASGLGNRAPTSMALEYSYDNSVWGLYATLTRSSSDTSCKWVSILYLSTIANSGP